MFVFFNLTLVVWLAWVVLGRCPGWGWGGGFSHNPFFLCFFGGGGGGPFFHVLTGTVVIGFACVVIGLARVWFCGKGLLVSPVGYFKSGDAIPAVGLELRLS